VLSRPEKKKGKDKTKGDKDTEDKEGEEKDEGDKVNI